MSSGPRPLVVLSGFLGSGKTTLLRRAVNESGGARTAVIVNELGEIGLDQHQFTQVAERTVLLDNGCLCCATRDDLRETLHDLLEAERLGTAPIERVALETSGLADPTPILATIERDPVLRHQFAIEKLVVTCDAEHVADQRSWPEWNAQVAAADLVALTKVDRVGALEARAAAGLVAARNPAALIRDGRELNLFAPGRPGPPRAVAPAGAREAPGARHGWGVTTASVAVRGAIEPDRMVVWLSALVHAHGARLLRTKAVLDVGAAHGPLVLDAVQHVVYPPRHLSGWSEERASSLVVIANELDASCVVRAFAQLFDG